MVDDDPDDDGPEPGRGMIRVTARAHPLSERCQRFAIDEGASLEGIFLASGAPERLRGSTSIIVGDAPVARELWRQVRPKPGALVNLVAVPQLGDGGLLRALLQISVVAAAAGATALGSPIAGSAVCLAGPLVVDATITEPRA